MADKIDSNITGLRFAEEASLKVLPGTPTWYPLEPNSYSDFGGKIATVARNPINASRQRKKGVTTDLDASGGFNQDLTMTNSTRLLQAFMFADMREKKSTTPMNGAATVIASVTSGTKTFAVAANGAGFLDGNIVFASGFGATGNNGIFTVDGASTATAIVVNETVVSEASPPSAAFLTAVGFEFPSADVEVSMNGLLPRLVATATDMTTLGLIPGEWIYLGGDTVNSAFTVNVGFARISVITADYLEFDKTSWESAAEVGTGKTIRMFFGDVLKNESSPNLIKRRTLQLERTLGSDGVGTQSEYLVGAVANELNLSIAQASKIAMDLSFVAVDNEQRSGTVGLKSGNRPTLDSGSAFNTSSDFARIKLSVVNADAAPDPLFAFATEMKLSLKNGVTPNKAIGTLGAFDTSVGTFEVGGSITAYFASVAAVQAVRNNADITLDVIMQKRNKALLWDIPLLSLGDGRLSVQQDQPITIPLETMAAESKFGHTLLFQVFSYLPNAAGGV